MNATVSIISLVISGIMMVLGLFTLIKSYGSSMVGQGRIEQKVNDIGANVTEIRDDIKKQATEYAAINMRVVKVEESTKSAHHRIDGLEKKFNEGKEIDMSVSNN